MNRSVTMALFLVVATALTLGIHIYLYRRLIVHTELPQPWRRRGKLLFVLLGGGLVLSMMGSRVVSVEAARILVFPFYIWLGPMFLLVVLLLLSDAGRLLVKVGRKLSRMKAEPDPDRRRFLARVVAGVTTGTVLSATAYGVNHALGELVVERLEVELPKLPRAMDGFCIVQITDLHLGPTRGGEWMAEVVGRVNELRPDLVAITGDLVDGSVEQLRDDVAHLGKLESGFGSFFVTGNHEYYSGAIEWVAELERIGVRVLRNAHVPIVLPTGEGFELAGVDDFRSKGLAEGHGHDVAASVSGRDETRALVMLAHQPRSIFEGAEHGVDLLLTGHTHGGQIWPVMHLSGLQNPYVRGLHLHGDTWIYVSSGTGFWGPPMRILSTAEITEVTLRAPSAERVFSSLD